MSKIILTITGPSGSGKTGIIKILQSQYGIPRIVTCTTRSPRPGEVDGRDYYFVDEKDFVMDSFIAPVRFAGNYYGIEADKVMEQLDHNDILAVVVEPSGASALKEKLESPGILVRRVYIDINPKKAMCYMARRDGWKAAKRRYKEDLEANMYYGQYELGEKYDCIIANGRSDTVRTMAYDIMNYLEAVQQEEKIKEVAEQK